jgi:choline kinase
MPQLVPSEPGVIGLVLAAGAGRRLRPYTETLPKTLIPIDGGRTVLDSILRNFAAVGLTDVALVVGHAAGALRERRADLERAYGLRLHLVDNDKSQTWNNAYSLWCARDYLADGVLLSNGDTVHPVSVEETLLAGRGPALLLALDTVKHLGEEEMKVRWSEDAGIERITKQMPPESAQGEYIGVSLIEPAAAAPLVEALEATWRRDPDLYYEDGYQELVDRGFRIDVAPIGTVDWVEIDDHADLARARKLVCRS